MNEEESAAEIAKGNNVATVAVSSPWHLSRESWVIILKRVWIMIGFHEVSLLAGGVAFFTFLAITPLIAAVVMTYGLIGDVAMVQRQMQSIIEVVPSDAASVIEDQLLAVVNTSTGVTGLALVIALFFAIYGGMRAASGLIAALNIINQEHETRNVIALTLRAAYLTLAAILIALTGLASGAVFAWLQVQSSIVLGSSVQLLMKLLTWTLAIALGSAGFALIMRHGPDRRPAKWRWLTPGSILATVLWLAISFGFSLYVAYISDYSATYGSLSAIVVFLMWLFLSAYGVLVGALLNAEIERQTNCDTTAGPDRPPGQRGAVLADVIDAPMPNDETLKRARLRRAERVRHQAGQ